MNAAGEIPKKSSFSQERLKLLICQLKSQLCSAAADSKAIGAMRRDGFLKTSDCYRAKTTFTIE
jgi:hypothetical protein